MTKLGVGKESGTLPHVSPDQLLDDPNTAVVLVQSIIPPGAPKDMVFDVRVDALPGTSTTSLEGGTLWTTQLRRGLALPAGPTTEPIAEARGAIFTNPFAPPGGQGIDAADKRTGHILSGGRVTNPFALALILDNPSFSRARAMVGAINARYPRGTNPKLTARGVNEDTIEINIPPQYVKHPDIFIKLLKHTRVEQSFPQEMAGQYVQALKNEPELADDLSWCLIAMGDIAIPFARQLYSYPEMKPQFAALQAGAYLHDPTTFPYLRELVLSGPITSRTSIIRLMAELPQDLKVDRFLIELLDSPDVDVRVAAYDALDQRGSTAIERFTADSKFAIHAVQSTEPTIYVTQQGEAKIVIFGGGIEFGRPAFVSGWDGHLMINSDSSTPIGKVNVFYRDPRTGHTVKGESSASLVRLIQFMAHKPTPEAPAPGLDLTYSEVVSALNELVKAGGLAAAIIPEQDMLALEILRGTEQQAVEERAELSEAGPVTKLETKADISKPAPAVGEAAEPEAAPAPATAAERAAAEEREKHKSQYVVPLTPPAPKGGDKPKP